MVIKGQKINDRYLIIRSIGEGGMANVYLAHDTILDRDVAIKILRGDLANDEKFVRRFQREALSASSLSHPSIVEMYDVGEDNGTYYIVMEYVDGKTIKQLIKRRGGLTLSESIDIMLQLTDGISHAHDKGIIHRDLKPQNILIKDDGSIKITDFGIAMALNSTQLTQTNSVMGSVHYLPPEQASGKGSTFRSDIYSMGILFYELLTGKLPFRGENAVEIALKHMKDSIPSVRSINPSIPQSIENVILKATAKNPKNRYSDAKEMHDDLLTALNDDRQNEPKYVYPFPEHEQDEKPIVKKPVKEEEPIGKEIEDTEDLEEDEEEEAVRKTSTWIWVLLGIFGTIVVTMIIIFLVVPAVTEVPTITITLDNNLKMEEAKKQLEVAGFEVDVVEEESTVEVGMVTRTEPPVGERIKKGSKVTLYVSKGKKVIVIKNYIDWNIIDAQADAMKEGLDVRIEYTNGDPEKEYKNETVIDQEPKEGTEASEGDTITLYRLKVFDKYPDMVEEGWTIDQVQEFCTQYNLHLTIDYEETTQYTPGMIIDQSRKANTTLVKGVDFRITVAKEPSDSGAPPEATNDPTEDLLPKDDSTETDKTKE